MSSAPESEPEGVENQPSPRAAFYLGRIGSKEMVEIALPFVTAPDGSVGIGIEHLGRLANSTEDGSMVWFRGSKELTQQLEEEAETKANLLGGRVIIDYNHMELLVDGQVQAIPPMPYRVLELLARNKGRVVTKKEIYKSIWESDWSGSLKVIDVHVTTARKTLGAYADILQNKRGIGFILDEKSHEER